MVQLRCSNLWLEKEFSLTSAIFSVSVSTKLMPCHNGDVTVHSQGGREVGRVVWEEKCLQRPAAQSSRQCQLYLLCIQLLLLSLKCMLPPSPLKSAWSVKIFFFNNWNCQQYTKVKGGGCILLSPYILITHVGWSFFKNHQLMIWFGKVWPPGLKPGLWPRDGKIKLGNLNKGVRSYQCPFHRFSGRPVLGKLLDSLFNINISVSQRK